MKETLFFLQSRKQFWCRYLFAGKGHSVESRIEKEHREVTHELQKQIDEHAQEVDSICERYEEQLNVSLYLAKKVVID